MFSSFLISADPELVGGDTLTCGVCRKEFALADIVKFIQHKVLTCNKENYRCATENGGDSTASGESDVDATTGPGTGANSTPISRTTTPQQQPRRHSISTVTPGKSSPTPDNNNDVKFEELTTSSTTAADSSRKKKVELVDAESNTIVSGKHDLFNTPLL